MNYKELKDEIKQEKKNYEKIIYKNSELKNI